MYRSFQFWFLLQVHLGLSLVADYRTAQVFPRAHCGRNLVVIRRFPLLIMVYRRYSGGNEICKIRCPGFPQLIRQMIINPYVLYRCTKPQSTIKIQIVVNIQIQLYQNPRFYMGHRNVSQFLFLWDKNNLYVDSIIYDICICFFQQIYFCNTLFFLFCLLSV